MADYGKDTPGYAGDAMNIGAWLLTGCIIMVSLFLVYCVLRIGYFVVFKK